MSFYPFDLFNGPFIIPVGCNGFEHDGDTISARAKVMINSESMRIIVVFDNFLSCAVYLIKIFDLKLLKIDLNTVPETLILDV